MAIYDFACTECPIEMTVQLSFAEHDTFKEQGVKCLDCGAPMRQVLGVTNVTIPGSCTHDGKTKVLGGVSGGRKKKEGLDSPINIWDKKDDGSYKVTRIGKKGDIDGD